MKHLTLALAISIFIFSAEVFAEVITLGQAQKMAMQRNVDIKNIDEIIYRADNQIKYAWSMLMPTLSANASITRNSSEISMQMPDFTAEPDPVTLNFPMNSLVIQEQWGRSAGFTANITLFNPRSIPLIKYAYDYTESARLEAKMQRNEILFAVTSAYYQASYMQELIRVHEENVKNAEHLLKLAQATLNVGKGTNLDVLRAKQQLLVEEKLLKNAQDAFEMAKVSLSYLIGVKDNFSVVGPAPVSAVNDDVSELTRQAKERRLEFENTEIQKTMADRSLTETKMKWLPTFDATFNWSWNSAAGFSGDNDSWMLIFGAHWNIFQGGQRIAETNERKSILRTTENNMEKLDLLIEKQIKQRHTALVNDQRNVEIADQQLALAEETHKVVTKQYEVGLVSSLDIIDAATALSNSRVMQVVERVRYDLSILRLKKEIGDYHELSAVSN